MQPRSVEGWLIWLDQQRPTDAQWSDAEYVQLLSWVMVMFLWRRMNQRLIDAGAAKEVRPEFR